MTLCPNCGTWIAEEELECRCFTCGFSARDLALKNGKRETKEEDSDQTILRLVSDVSSGAKDAE